MCINYCTPKKNLFVTPIKIWKCCQHQSQTSLEAPQKHYNNLDTGRLNDQLVLGQNR